MKTAHISDSEWIIMESLWTKSPRTASEVARAVCPETKWAANTVRTLLTRLVEKGVLTTGENSSGVRMYAPKVSREAMVKSEGRSFMQRVFQGASKPLLVHFATHSDLSPTEIKELKELLDQSLEDHS